MLYIKIAHQKKPTGDPDMPMYVRHAKRIEGEINAKTDTIDVNDPAIWSDKDFNEGSSIDNSGEDTEDEALDTAPAIASSKTSTATPTLNATTSKAPKRDHTAVKEESPTPLVAGYKRAKTTPGDSSSWSSHTQGRKGTAGGNLMQNMLSFLDPEARAERQGIQSAHTMMLMQIRSLEQQLLQRDNKIDQLHQELQVVREAKNQAERRADRLQSELQMMQMMQRMGPPMSYGHPRSYNGYSFLDDEDTYPPSQQGYTTVFPLPRSRMSPTTPARHSHSRFGGPAMSTVHSSRAGPSNQETTNSEELFSAGGMQVSVSADKSSITISPSKDKDQDSL